MINPFEFNNPVHDTAFFDRKRETRRLVEGILKGHSALISAEPRTGKTSLLNRIQVPALYGDQAAHLHFRYFDGHQITGWDPRNFWEEALVQVKGLSPEIFKAYQTADLEKFGAFSLEQIFARMDATHEKLVLLIDEFDMVLEEPGLHKGLFYGGLRALATRFSSLVLVLASRQSLEELNRRTLEFSLNSSPYFNFLEEITLGAFPLRETATLLSRGGAYFNTGDRIFAERVSGGHPFFLQTCASYLWEVRDQNAAMRRQKVGELCFQQVFPTLKDIWRTWTPYQQMTFTLAALDEMPRLLPDREFDINRLLKDRPNFAPEQRILKNRGFLRPDPTLEGGYAPQSEIMVWFLAEELTRLLRPQDPDLAKWLRDQQWEGQLKHGEIEGLKKALQSLKPILKDGAIAFIKAAAEGLGTGITGRITSQ